MSSEAHILFWDIRNTKEPAYRHSSTHSDEITHLSLLPPTSSFASSSTRTLPTCLLLSGSVDGCVALSDMAETDEEEAVQAEENWNASIAGAGAYMADGGMRVWARSDMDTMATWGVGTGAEGELEVNSRRVIWRWMGLTTVWWLRRDCVRPVQAAPHCCWLDDA